MVLDRIEDALAAMARGAMVVVVDDEDRENEGDLILAAEHATPEAIAFMVRHTSGMLCVGLPGERLDELALPLMVERNTDSMRTAYAVTVDLRHGTTTGISAADRAATVRALVDPAAAADDFNRPGQYRCLGSFGLAIAERVPLTTPPTRENVAYLRTKQTRLGHVLDLAEEPPAVH